VRKIAIVGKCSNSRADAPLESPGWEIWGLAWDPLPICHRYFEMHQNWRNFLGGGDAAEEHWRWLAGMSVPVVMLQQEHDIPMSVAYPMDEIADKVSGRTCYGTAYLESSISYMMAMAILEGADRIGIWGCDLATGGEYAYQRPNMEMLIGVARGKGIEVYVPAQNALLSPCRRVPYGLEDPDAGKKVSRPAWLPETPNALPKPFDPEVTALKVFQAAPQRERKVHVA
jgi:hypothetical protein